MKIPSIHLLVLILISVIFTSACAQAQPVTVENAWARPTLSGDNGAVYFEIYNPGQREETLLGASSQVAEKAEIHESAMDSAGTMSMHPMHGVAVPAGETILFEPGSLHVMLVSLNRNFQVGDTFQLTLTFENSGEQIIDVKVKQP